MSGTIVLHIEMTEVCALLTDTVTETVTETVYGPHIVGVQDSHCE
jgi:hypothetical protein